MNDLAALEARYFERVLAWAMSTASYAQVKKAWEDWKAEHRRIHGA